MNNAKVRPTGVGYLCVCKYCCNGGSATKRTVLKGYNRKLRKQAKDEIDQQLLADSEEE
jgi:hypothetical protein